MRYRLEQLHDDKLVIRNVETDAKLGYVDRIWLPHPSRPHEWMLSGCTIRNRKGVELATIGPPNVPRPLQEAAKAVATHEAYYGYPGFKVVAKDPQPNRIERRLGTLLADAVFEIACALIERGNGGLKSKTKRRCGKLIAQLYAIWYVSRFGSFNAERWATEPYFANVPASGPRLSFAEAVQIHGMFELRMRYPDASEATLKLGLSWPIELLKCLLNSLVPANTASEFGGQAAASGTIPDTKNKEYGFVQ